MWIKFLINPTVHLLYGIEAHGGEVINYHDSSNHTNVVTSVKRE